MRYRKPARILGLGIVAMTNLFILTACGNAIPQGEVAAKDQQIAEQQTQIARLQGQLNELQKDNKFWQQLTSLMEPDALDERPQGVHAPHRGRYRVALRQHGPVQGREP
jgi:uncharacterized coiled-coil protein SlyX